VTDIDTKSALDEAAHAFDVATEDVKIGDKSATMFVALSIFGAGILIAKAIGKVADAIAARANPP
jgi:hypothetical protein